ncbi:alpha-L-fucosidase [Subdoligranulum sp. AF14-43]|uniref:alpha-L-fucosidase n=1 Tax=Ruthenibacterium lactatiformans TaxID=1550024 RepID=UPI000EC4E2AE|nr:alpha-L-fucosidase [Ruthenibacterium lactatiformans]RJV93635.1 alpha-L-fucosidase [Subdoligranulum sp. AF14-43]
MSCHQIRKTAGDTSWFRHDRFGMYIYWGQYAMPARHEWVKYRERLTEERYNQYFELFDPDMYDAKEWARQAREAGMKYVVMTTKHHEGFCMFDSQYTDYKCTNTPAGRDLIREYVDAFRAEGLHIGFYYSLLDWHHPDFPIDMVHPRCDDPDAYAQNQGRDIRKYAQYMRDQIRELLTNYGKIDILWMDYSYPGREHGWMRGKGKDDWESEELIAMIRSIQPDIIINNRTGIEQDLWTPEQYQPTTWPRHNETGELVTWEACQTFSGSWGYHRDELSWKSPEMLINLLIRTVSLGGNLLMNVGPTARGYLDYRAKAALKTYADWMRYNNKSIYGCTMADPALQAPNGCYYTQSEDGKRLYVHLVEYPFAFLELPGLAHKVRYAQFLQDNSEILMDREPNFMPDEGHLPSEDLLVLTIPLVKPNILVPVIELLLY